MSNRWFKWIGTAVVAGAIGVVALTAVASAQGPTTTPTAPTTPNSQTAPNQKSGGFGWFGFGHAERGLGGIVGPNSLITAFASALGTTESNVLTQLQSGKTLAELAQAKSVNTATVISDYLKPYQDALTTAVTNKQLTQAQADARLALRKADAEAFLDFKYDPANLPQRGQGGFGGFGGFGDFDFNGGPGGHGHRGGGGQQQQPQQPQVPQSPSPTAPAS